MCISICDLAASLLTESNIELSNASMCADKRLICEERGSFGGAEASLVAPPCGASTPALMLPNNDTSASSYPESWAAGVCLLARPAPRLPELSAAMTNQAVEKDPWAWKESTNELPGRFVVFVTVRGGQGGGSSAEPRRRTHVPCS